MSDTPNVYSLPEQQIKIYLEALVRQIGHNDAYENRVVAKVGQHMVEVYTSFDMYEIAVFHEASRELFAYAKYDRDKGTLLYTLRYHLISGCLNDLIAQDV